MTTDVERLQPFDKRDAGAIRFRLQLALERGEARANLLQQRLRLRSAAGFFSHPQDVAPDIAQILRIQAKNFRTPFESRKRGSEIIRGSRADVAQILGD